MDIKEYRTLIPGIKKGSSHQTSDKIVMRQRYVTLSVYHIIISQSREIRPRTSLIVKAALLVWYEFQKGFLKGVFLYVNHQSRTDNPISYHIIWCTLSEPKQLQPVEVWRFIRHLKLCCVSKHQDLGSWFCWFLSLHLFIFSFLFLESVKKPWKGAPQPQQWRISPDACHWNNVLVGGSWASNRWRYGRS